MKVIKDNRYFTFPLRLAYGGCQSELEADSEDVISDNISEVLRGKYRVTCPLCSTRNAIQSPDPYYSKS